MELAVNWHGGLGQTKTTDKTIPTRPALPIHRQRVLLKEDRSCGVGGVLAWWLRTNKNTRKTNTHPTSLNDTRTKGSTQER